MRTEFVAALVAALLATPSPPEPSPAASSVPSMRVEFPKGVTRVRLPARIVAGLIVVRGEIKGRGVDFVLDTGSYQSALESSTAAQLGITPGEGRTEVGCGTAGGSYTMGFAAIPTMTVGDLTMTGSVAVFTIPFWKHLDTGTRIGGLLGSDFLNGAALTVDYDKGTVDAVAPDAFVPPADTEPIALHIDGVPMAALTIGAVTGDHFIVDTGAQGWTVAVNQGFLKRHAADVDPSAMRGGTRMARFGLCPSDRPSRTTPQQLTFGPWVINGVHVWVFRNAPQGEDFDGFIGGGILSKFRVIIDEPHQRLYLQEAAGA